MGRAERPGGCGADRAWTRAELLRASAAGGAGLLLLGGAGALAERVLGVAGAERERGRGIHRFHSRPDLRPPLVEIVQPARGAAPGVLFLAPSSGPGQRGVLIVDDLGEVVWFRSTEPLTAMDFRAAVYRGEPVLTWWEGRSHDGRGVGECVIVDRSYREIARIGAGRRPPLDLHELLLTPHDTALVTATEVRTMNLEAVGGASRWPVLGSVVQELALPSGRVLFEWRSLDHVALEESHQAIGPRFDYFHANSVAVDADDDLLVSARNTWAVYKLDRGSGEVRWRLGGKRSDFAMGPGTFFAWQHDARSHDGGRVVSLFDDGGEPAVEHESSARIIALDTRRMRASLERRYVHHPPLLARKTGSVQLLPDGGVLVGWGTEPYVTEFSPDGGVRFEAALPPGGQTYRARRFPWTGDPVDPPSLRRARVDGEPVLCASWNGATRVAGWRLLAGPGGSALRPLLTTRRRGFETLFPVGAASGVAVAVALDGAGRELGRTAPVALDV